MAADNRTLDYHNLAQIASGSGPLLKSLNACKSRAIVNKHELKYSEFDIHFDWIILIRDQMFIIMLKF